MMQPCTGSGKSAKQGNPDAQYQLGLYFAEVAQDQTEAKQWLRKAAAHGHDEAQQYLDEMTE